jgi:hypothetical protein
MAGLPACLVGGYLSARFGRLVDLIENIILLPLPGDS